MIRRLLLGPFSPDRSLRGRIWALFLIGFLTLITQIGGLVLWLAYGLGAVVDARFAGWRRVGMLGAFIALYAVATVAVVPSLAQAFGRVPLDCFGKDNAYAANSIVYCALNRHYARPKLRQLLERLSAQLARTHPGTVVSYLDAGFPFLDSMPMLPHWTHRDGRSVDLALFYVDGRTDQPKPKGGAWPIGYWAYAPAWALGPEEVRADRRDGPMRWNLPHLQGLFDDVDLDRGRTADMLRILSEGEVAGTVRRVLLEPYLARTLGVESPKVGFAGWNAARHDDHAHVLIR